MEDRIAKLCYDKYCSLGKNGKPRKEEWTLLSGFVVESEAEEMQVVSLATGTKCIGQSKMSPVGSVLNDSHAEVLSRRGLMRYFYENMEATKKGESSTIFEINSNGKYNLKPDIRFHFFCSHVPCGDASIIPMMKRKSENSTDEGSKKLKVSAEQENTVKDLHNVEDEHVYDDIHRTGSKCVLTEDPHGPGVLYHTLGAVRTKPGRGDRTLSLSCSDKIAKWIYCGLQGALLALLLEKPIYLDSITIGGGGQFCMRAMERGLFERSQSQQRPVIKQSSLVFMHSRYLIGLDSNPCATALIWSQVRTKPFEVSVEGRRLGVTRKSKDSTGRLKISKMELFIEFAKLTGGKYDGMTYKEVKSQAKSYYANVSNFIKNMGSWSNKPELLNFLPDL